MRKVLLGGPRRLAFDSFTGTNGTSLSAHPLDTGQSWALSGTGTLTIQNNTCQTGTGSAIAFALTDLHTAAVKVEADVTPGTANDLPLLVGGSDGNNVWQLDLNQSDGKLELYQSAGGVATLRASTTLTITAGTTYHVAVTDTGAVLTGFVNGVAQLSYASTTRYGTKCGIQKGGSNFTTSGTFDNFQVSTLS